MSYYNNMEIPFQSARFSYKSNEAYQYKVCNLTSINFCVCNNDKQLSLFMKEIICCFQKICMVQNTFFKS